MRYKKNEKLLIALFVLIPTAIYLLFVIYPVASSLVNSFYDWRGIGEKTWIGFGNYTRMFKDENFINSLTVTFKYIIIQVPILVLVSLIFSFLIVNIKKSKFQSFYKSSIFFPYILPVVAVTMLWGSMFNPVSGLINAVLDFLKLGFLKREWLGQMSTAFGSVVWVNIWISTGFYVILLLSGILNIPEEIMESAEIDGANRFQVATKITLPMLKPVIQVAITFCMINTLKLFTQPQLLTNGGPDRSTQPISLYIYEHAFKNFNFGYASAMGVVFFLMILIITGVTLRMTRGDNK